MYLYVETWNAKPEWLALAPQQRQEFAAQVGELLGELISEDLKLLGCAISDPDVDRHGGYSYVAVWQASDRAQTTRIEEGTARIGWHDYFEQVNHGSTLVGPEAVVGHMVGA